MEDQRVAGLLVLLLLSLTLTVQAAPPLSTALTYEAVVPKEGLARKVDFEISISPRDIQSYQDFVCETVLQKPLVLLQMPEAPVGVEVSQGKPALTSFIPNANFRTNRKWNCSALYWKTTEILLQILCYNCGSGRVHLFNGRIEGRYNPVRGFFFWERASSNQHRLCYFTSAPIA